MRNLINKIITTILSIALISFSSINAFANTQNNRSLDTELVTSVLSLAENYTKSLDELGISIDMIKSLEYKGEDFINECYKYIKSSQENSKISERIETPTKNAKELSYAMSVARRNIKDITSPKYANEVVYMYLSHYTDNPYNNFEDAFCEYITDYDRSAYDTYLSRGSAIKSANAMRSTITNLVSLGVDLQSGKEILMKHQKSTIESGIEIASLGIDIDSLISMVRDDLPAIFKNSYSKFDNPEDIIEDVQNTMSINYKEYNKQAGFIILGVIFSALTFSPPIMSLLAVVNSYGMLIADIFDKANFTALIISRNSRIGERIDLYLYG